MKKALKITGIIVGILVLIVLVLAVMLSFLLNPNHFKDDIARIVHKKTGRELVIQGDVKLSVFPWLGVQIGSSELSNAKGFGAVPFAAVNETDVHMAFWPLLHRRIQVGEVKVEGVSLDLERDADGHSNWQDISDHLARNGAAAGGEDEEPGFTVDLSGADIGVSDSQVRWTDAQKHQQYTISDFSMKMGAFTPAQPFALQSAFDFTGTNPALQGHVDFSGNASADLEHHIYSSDDAKLEVQAKGDPVPGSQVDALMQWQHAALNTDQDSMALNGFSLGAYGFKLQVEAQGKDVSKQPSFNGTLKVASFSPRDVLKALGHPGLTNTRDPAAFGNAVASTSFVASGSSLALSSLDMTLDNSHITGSVAVKDFKTEALSFDLSLDQLDVDRYLPPQQLGTPDKPREEVDIDKIGIPLRTLRSLNLDGHLHAGQFTLLGTKTGDLDLGVSAHNGLTHVTPLTATLYGGALSGDLQVDASSDSPVVTETLDLKSVQLAGFAQDFAKSSRLSGTLDLSSATRALGRTVAELRRTVSGRLSYTLKGGVLQGVNVWDAVARAYATAKSLPQPAPGDPHTDFSLLHGTASINRGLMSDRSFGATLPGLSLSGSGKVDLVELTVDYSLKAHASGAPKLGAGEDLGSLKGQDFPLHLSGTLGNLNVRPDLSGLKGRI